MDNKVIAQQIRSHLNYFDTLCSAIEKEDVQVYFDYDSVLDLLIRAKDLTVNKESGTKPPQIPDGMPWSKSLTEEGFEPFVYKGDMSFDDFRVAQEKCLRDKLKRNKKPSCKLKFLEVKNGLVIAMYSHGLSLPYAVFSKEEFHSTRALSRSPLYLCLTIEEARLFAEQCFVGYKK